MELAGLILFVAVILVVERVLYRNLCTDHCAAIPPGTVDRIENVGEEDLVVVCASSPPYSTRTRCSARTGDPRFYRTVGFTYSDILLAMARTVIWAYGFDKEPAQVEAEVDAIGPLQYDTVILPFIHVHREGSADFEITYNDTPIEKLWDGLPEALERLKSGFEVKKQLLFSVGPFGSDFEAIATDYHGFVDDFVELAAAHHVDGMDLDFEGDFGDRSMRKLLALMVGVYRNHVPGGLITAAPYTAEEFWAGPEGVLELSRSESGSSNFDWFNVQFYEGPGNVPPQEYPETFDLWAKGIGREDNGVPDPEAFIVPGCNGTKEAGGSFPPTNLEEGLAAIRRDHGPIGGGFVWNYEGLEWTPQEWAEAIVNGCR